MKKLLCLIALLCLAACAFAETAEAPAETAPAEKTWVDIRTPEDLAAIANDPYGHYRLMNDIDMTGVDWLPIKFAGILDGQNHALMNLRITRTGETEFPTMDGNSKVYTTVGAGLFDCGLNAEIDNLAIVGLQMEISTSQNCFCGAFFGGGKDISVDNCAVIGRIFLKQSARMTGLGGIYGFAYGDVSNSYIDVDLCFVDTNTGETCEEFCGGVVACGHASIAYCNVTVDMYTSVHGFVHNGGLIGMHERGQTKSANELLAHNTVDMDVTFFEDAPFKRSYNNAYVGEHENHGANLMSNTTKHYHRENTHNFKKDIYPCTCDAVKEDTVVAATVGKTGYGYTLHTCPNCGYAYRDTFISPLSEAEAAAVPAEPEAQADESEDSVF